MPKFFVSSDIHSFYDEWMSALNAAGYDNKNEDHYLIVCGDVFDRGKQPIEVMRFLNINPRTILVRGNHEDLFDDMCLRGCPLSHDYSNGTFDTVLILGSKKDCSQSQEEVFDFAYKRTRGLFDKMVDYFETKNYVFVHGNIVSDYNGIIPANWRNSENSKYWWETARWDSPLKSKYKLENYKYGVDNKTIVFGHWHCSKGHNLVDYTPEFGEGSNFDIFKYEKLIGIDACTAYSHKVNVLVIEDDFLED